MTEKTCNKFQTNIYWEFKRGSVIALNLSGKNSSGCDKIHLNVIKFFRSRTITFYRNTSSIAGRQAKDSESLMFPLMLRYVFGLKP